MHTCYIELDFTHKSFTSGKIAIVTITVEPGAIIKTLVKTAKQKLCDQLKLETCDVIVTDFRFLGEDVIIIN